MDPLYTSELIKKYQDKEKALKESENETKTKRSKSSSILSSISDDNKGNNKTKFGSRKHGRNKSISNVSSNSGMEWKQQLSSKKYQLPIPKTTTKTTTTTNWNHVSINSNPTRKHFGSQINRAPKSIMHMTHSHSSERSNNNSSSFINSTKKSKSKKATIYRSDIKNENNSLLSNNKRGISNSFGSFGSKEVFYGDELEYLKHGTRDNKIAYDQVNGLQKHILSKKESETTLETINNWKKALRGNDLLPSRSDQVRPKSRMRFGEQHRKNYKSRNQIGRDIAKIRVKPLSEVHRRLLRLQGDHWSFRRGHVGSATAPVDRNDFFRLFDSFKAAALSTNKKIHKHGSNSDQELFISDKEIYKIAMKFGIETSEREVRKVADILDEDGSRQITFPELIHAFEHLRNKDRAPFIGGNMTVDHLLLANRRRELLDNVIGSHNELAMRNQSATNNSYLNISNLELDLLESQHFLHNKQKFDEKTRKKLNQCHYCYKDFQYSKQLEAHILEIHKYKNKYFTCYQCGQKWILKEDKQSHMRKHFTNKTMTDNKKDDRFKCHYCKHVFASRQVLAYHHSQNHKPLTLDIFQCAYCIDSFDTQIKLNNHENEYHIKHLKIKQIKQAKRDAMKNNESDTIDNGGIDDIDKLEDYDSDNDMSPEEYDDMRQAFFNSQSRKLISQRAHHFGHILNFRLQYDLNTSDMDTTVTKLKTILDDEDEQQQKRAIMHISSMLGNRLN